LDIVIAAGTAGAHGSSIPKPLSTLDNKKAQTPRAILPMKQDAQKRLGVLSLKVKCDE